MFGRKNQSHGIFDKRTPLAQSEYRGQYHFGDTQSSSPHGTGVQYQGNDAIYRGRFTNGLRRGFGYEFGDELLYSSDRAIEQLEGPPTPSFRKLDRQDSNQCHHSTECEFAKDYTFAQRTFEPTMQNIAPRTEQRGRFTVRQVPQDAEPQQRGRFTVRDITDEYISKPYRKGRFTVSEHFNPTTFVPEVTARWSNDML